LDDLTLNHLVGISDEDLHQKAVELRLWQRISAFLLYGILSREHHEQLWQLVGVFTDGDLSFFHRFEQRRLYIGGRTVDLVCKEQNFEDWPYLKGKLTTFYGLNVNVCDGYIGR